MAQVDIPVPESLRKALSAPVCLDLSLPKPKKLTVTLPSGAAFSSLSNLGQNIPNDCSLTFSLMMQVMPMMASMECVLKILKLLKPLSEAVTSPPPTPKLVADIGKAVADLAPCFLMLTPAGMIPFVRDVLCLILKVLSCLVAQLKNMGKVLGGLAITLKDARARGDDDLAATVECAQQNTITSMGHLMQGLGPVEAIMDLAAPFMSIAGVAEIKLPAIGSAEDVEGMNKVVAQLDEVMNTIQKIVDGLGGCPS
ncbi:hypothetical protein F2P45_11495 [Massilia sp. CCM 8733]|uniref:Uncharacterized protein n=1 Tax=Massilia mucilaginosa TaxID=2609282 RepID=A0ABX0NS03_9BURK|nr:hypothetical protein [Massilia mucilaginosa]NHZ89632.1 hypothetical protein [Massilia mucilaginosa]